MSLNKDGDCDKLDNHGVMVTIILALVLLMNAAVTLSKSTLQYLRNVCRKTHAQGPKPLSICPKPLRASSMLCCGALHRRCVAAQEPGKAKESAHSLRIRLARTLP